MFYKDVRLNVCNKFSQHEKSGINVNKCKQLRYLGLSREDGMIDEGI